MSALLYILVITGLVTLAAIAAERVFTALRLPTRWLWIGAMGVSMMVAPAVWSGILVPDSADPVGIPLEVGGHAPALDRSLPETSAPEASAWEVVAGGIGVAIRTPARWLDGAIESVAAGSGLRQMEGAGPMAASIWLLLSAALAGVLLLSWRRLDRRRSRWPRAHLLSRPVRISDGLGPAVVGIRRPEIVLPDRMLGLSEPRLGLVLRHEAEHLTAGDTRLLGAGLLPLVAFPWNPFLWVQSRRLRVAVELDCDARVLGSGVAVRDYARTLIEIGGDRFPGLSPSPALTGPGRLLERRIRTMKPRTRLQRIPVALAGGLLAVALVAMACEVDTPTAEPSVDGPDPAAVDVSASLDLESQPLVIVDGVITSREQLNDDFGETLSPERIESVEVTKGADAVERYGERAAAGVIAITTRDAPEIETLTVSPEIEAPAPPEPTEPARPDDMTVEEYTGARVLGTDSVDPPEPPVEGTLEVSRLERGPDAVGEREFIQGRVAGARILRGGDSSDLETGTIRLSGPVSITPSEKEGPSALIVIDGVINASGTIDIPPEQIESVEVIKGAAASELYGSRAANGVIQITTRRPDGEGPGGEGPERS